jgi:hypothetical protein
MSNVFDATNLKEKGQALRDKISDEVNSSANFIIGAVPDVLKITQKQYKQLAGLDSFEQMNYLSQITGEVRPVEGANMFKTAESPRGSRYGGFLMEVEIDEHSND